MIERHAQDKPHPQNVFYGPKLFGINRAFKAIRRSQVVLFVIDALDGVNEQDQKLAGRITDDGHTCILAVNKWDAVTKDTYTINESAKQIRSRLTFMDWAETGLFHSTVR